jgi:hypothetical protein
MRFVGKRYLPWLTAANEILSDTLGIVTALAIDSVLHNRKSSLQSSNTSGVDSDRPGEEIDWCNAVRAAVQMTLNDSSLKGKIKADWRSNITSDLLTDEPLEPDVFSALPDDEAVVTFTNIETAESLAWTKKEIVSTAHVKSEEEANIRLARRLFVDAYLLVDEKLSDLTCHLFGEKAWKQHQWWVVEPQGNPWGSLTLTNYHGDQVGIDFDADKREFTFSGPFKGGIERKITKRGSLINDTAPSQILTVSELRLSKNPARLFEDRVGDRIRMIDASRYVLFNSDD